MDTIRIGTRGSQLALAQTETIINSLQNNFPDQRFEKVVIKTRGDIILDTALSKIGDKGLFTKEIEHELLEGSIDMAVHSMKDMPTILPEGLVIGAICHREETNDVFISNSISGLNQLKPGDRVATSSLRRKCQLLAMHPRLKIVDIRGNIITRIKKLDTYPDIKGTLLAYAGVKRLGMEKYIKEIIPQNVIVPAAGQGALAVEIRENDPKISELLVPLMDENTKMTVLCERTFLALLEGGCQVPIGANAVINGDYIRLTGMIASLDGTILYKEHMSEYVTNYEKLAQNLAEYILDRGGKEILMDIQWNKY